MAKKKEELIDEILNDPSITENMRAQLKKELEDESKQKTRDVVYEILKVFGLALLTLFILVGFEMLFELSLFGAIFQHSHYTFWWGQLMGTDKIGGWKIDDVMYSYDAAKQLFASSGYADFNEWLTAVNAVQFSPAFDDWLWFSNPWLPSTIITLVMIGMGAGLALVYSIVINDIISLVKRLKGIGKAFFKETTGNVQEAFESQLAKDKEEKTLFDADDEVEEEKVIEEKVKKEKKQRVPKPKKEKVEDYEVKKRDTTESLFDDVDDATLDELLKAPHTAEEQNLLTKLESNEDTPTLTVVAEAAPGARVDTDD